MPYPSLHKPIGLPFIELQTVDSTNNYALARIHAGLAQHGMCIFAHEQVAGKGQRGKKWESARDQNIALSIVLNPAPLGVSDQFRLSACIAVAAREFLARYTGGDTTIKWPNDLYWKDRKAGGILIENTIGKNNPGTSRWNWAVAGIGINVNEDNFPPGLANPVSVKQITGKEHDPVKMAKELCVTVDRHVHSLLSGGNAEIFSAYLAHLYKRNEKVQLKKGNRVFEALIKGVSADGRLIVQHGMEEQYGLGEITWLIK